MALIDPIASPQFLRQLLSKRGSGYKKVGGLGLDWPDIYYDQRPSVEMIEREAIPPYNEQSQPQPFGSGYTVLGNPNTPQPLVFSGAANMEPPGGMAIDPVWNNITEMLHQQRRQGALLAEKIPPFFPGYTQGELPPNPWAASPGITPTYPPYPPEAGILGMGGGAQDAPADYPQSAGSPQGGAGGGLFGRMRSGLSNNWLPIMQAGLGMMAGGGWGRMPRDFLQIAGEAGGPALQTKMHLDQQAFRNKIAESEEETRRMARAAYAKQAETQALEQQAKDEARKLKKEAFTEYTAAQAANDPVGMDRALNKMLAADDPAELAKYIIDQKKAEAKANEGDPVFLQKKRELMAQGVPEQVASGIAAGRYTVSRDPISGEAVVIDLATGQRRGGQLPAGAPSQQPTTKPPVDVSQATGGSGVFGNIVNRFTDAVGLGLMYPDVEEAVNAVKEINALTKTQLQSAVPGRNSVELMRTLESAFNIEPKSLMTGDAAAITKLKGVRNLIAQEAQRMESQILANPGNFKPDEISKTRVNLTELKGMLSEYDRLIQGFGKVSDREERKRQGGIPPLPSGVPQGSMWSKSRRQFRDRNGRLYDETGKPVD